MADDGAVARAFVELPDGWGPSQVVLTAWKRGGYDVAKLMCEPNGPNLLIFNGVQP